MADDPARDAPPYHAPMPCASVDLRVSTRRFAICTPSAAQYRVTVPRAYDVVTCREPMTLQVCRPGYVPRAYDVAVIDHRYDCLTAARRTAFGGERSASPSKNSYGTADGGSRLVRPHPLCIHGPCRLRRRQTRDSVIVATCTTTVFVKI